MEQRTVPKVPPPPRPPRGARTILRIINFLFGDDDANIGGVGDNEGDGDNIAGGVVGNSEQSPQATTVHDVKFFPFLLLSNSNKIELHFKDFTNMTKNTIFK